MRSSWPDLRAEARLIFRLAWPVMLSSLSWTLMQLTDVAVIGQAGTFEVAAFGASRTLTFIAIVTGMGWMSGVLVNIARAEGARTPESTGNYLREGLLLGLLLGVVIGAVMALAGGALLTLIGVAPALVPLTAKVVLIMGLAFPLQLVSIGFSYFLQAIGRARRALVINCIILPLNALLAWSWAGGHLGLPAMGAVGATLATLLASGAGLVLSGVAVWSLEDAGVRRVRRVRMADWAQAARGVPTLARFGSVPALASALELGGFSWVMVISTQLGLVVAHAFQLILSMHNVTFGFAMGFGSAAGVRVGNAVGEGNPRAGLHRTLIAAALTTGVVAFISAILMLFAGPIIALYPATGPVRTLAVAMLLIWAPFMLFDGLQLVFTYALRSLGDQVAAGVNSVIAFFVVTVGVGWSMIRAGYGAYALVGAVVAGMVVCAMLQGARMIQISLRLPRRSSG